MDYIIYRKDCEERPWVRFANGDIFLTGDRYVADEELSREKKDGDAVIISLRYKAVEKNVDGGFIQKCTILQSHRKIGEFHYYMANECDSDHFYDKLEEMLPKIVLDIK